MTSIPESAELVMWIFRAVQPLSTSPHSARAKFVDCSRSVSWQMFCSTESQSARNA